MKNRASTLKRGPRKSPVAKVELGPMTNLGRKRSLGLMTGLLAEKKKRGPTKSLAQTRGGLGPLISLVVKDLRWTEKMRAHLGKNANSIRAKWVELRLQNGVNLRGA